MELTATTPQKEVKIISFRISTEQYAIIQSEADAAGYRSTNIYARWLVLHRRSPTVIDLSVMRKNTLRVGAAVDLAADVLRTAEREPDAWMYEADLDAVRDLLDEVRAAQVEICRLIAEKIK